MTIGIIGAGLVVAVFVVLTGREVLAAASQPLNPLEESAQEAASTALPPLPQVGVVLMATPEPGIPTPTPIPIPTDDPELANNRTTILMMGIDRRPGDPFISRTDTMMLLSIDPDTETASLLSIPRDLYVVIPGRGRDRINTAFVYGANGDSPAAGAALAMQTIEYNLGVPVDHYLMVDFGAFIQSVDALGGIEVNVPYNIDDPLYPDMNYGYDPLFIPAGFQHFDGELALKYARTRHQDNDFYRAQRQQQVLFAIRDRALALGVTGLIQQAPVLYAQFSDGIRTDLSLEQIIALANIAVDIPEENIQSAVLDHNYVTDYRTEAGAQVLVLINEAAGPLIESMFLGD